MTKSATPRAIRGKSAYEVLTPEAFHTLEERIKNEISSSRKVRVI